MEVICPVKCDVPACHHKYSHEFNKVTCSLTYKLKHGCIIASTCVPLSQIEIPCDDCVRLDCEWRGRVFYEEMYHTCGYVTKETLKRTSVLIIKPNCYGFLYDKNAIECIECEISTKCILKCIETVDKGLMI